jgi:molybdenum cofactor biosynthesis enzyme MoaA
MALQRINIEIDTRCNARCFYCDTGNKSAIHIGKRWMSIYSRASLTMR